MSRIPQLQNERNERNERKLCIVSSANTGTFPAIRCGELDLYIYSPSLHPLRQIIQTRLGVDHHRVQTGMPQQRRQPTQVAGIGGQVARSKGIL